MDSKITTPKLTLSQALCMGAQGFRNLELAAIFGFTSKALLSMSEDPNFEVTDEQASWIGASVPLMALVGSLAGGKFIESFGRRRVSIVTGIPSFIAWITIATSSTPHGVIFGRLINGFCLGLQQVSTTVYVSETVHAKLRPTLSLIPAVIVTLGFIMINLCGIYTNWRGMAWYGALSGLPLFLLLLLVLPETPYYFLKSGSKTEAKRTLIWLRSTEQESLSEMKDLEQSFSQSTTKETVKLLDLLSPPYRWPILIAIILHITQQATGMSSVMSFTGLIFKDSGSLVDTDVSSMVNTTINLFTLIYVSRQFSTLPRKYFLKIGSIYIVTGHLVLALFFFVGMNEVFLLENHHRGALFYIPFLCVTSISLGFCFGWAPIPWMFIGESFPLKVRGIGAGVVTALNWAVNFLVTKTFIWTTKHWGYHIIFMIYATFTSLGTLFLTKHMPETFGFSDTRLEKYYKDLYKIKTK